MTVAVDIYSNMYKPLISTYIHIETDRQTEIERDRDREKSYSYSQTLLYKDCSFGSVKKPV